MNLPDVLQRPKVLQATLRKITERLAVELAQPTEMTPDWSQLEWTVACAVATMHGVSPLLAHTLRWHGPPQWMAFLQQQRAHTTRRHARIAELLHRIDRAACRLHLAGVALKGAELHAIGVYSPGDRPMADIDLLVRPCDAARATAMLGALGYRASYVGWKETVFIPLQERIPGEFGEHSDNDIKIELHERVCEKLPLRITDASGHLFPVEARPGLNPYPSLASLMMHLLLHAAGAMAFQSLRLLHLHDIARLAMRMKEPDWDPILNSNVGGEPPWWAFSPLRVTSAYYRHAIPARVLQSVRAKTPWVLSRISQNKTLCDVSFSHLWVDAFPGIEWCRSAGDMIRYAATRVRPSRAHLVEREMTAKTQAWASGSRWSSMSQGRRILRRMVSRQVRDVTLHAVKAAMAHAR